MRVHTTHDLRGDDDSNAILTCKEIKESTQEYDKQEMDPQHAMSSVMSVLDIIKSNTFFYFFSLLMTRICLYICLFA